MSSKQALDIPAYRLHKPTGQAVVRLNGHDFYLGAHGSAESKARYDRTVNEWLARGRQPLECAPEDAPTVSQLILAFVGHLTGQKAELADKERQALRAVRELYGETQAIKFGVLAFKAIRQKFMDEGLAITTIRDRMGIIRRMVGFGVENEFLTADAFQRIQAVAGLRVGRDRVKPSKKIPPAPDADVDAVLPFVGPVVGAMIQIQRLTGARPGEIRRMTVRQIDRSGDLWCYRPASHKTAGLGKNREVWIGPQAREILAGFLTADQDTPLFSPAASRAAFLAQARADRKTKVQPSQKDRRKPNPKRKPGKSYSRDAYKEAIRRGCLKAGVPTFTPNQIRHSVATRVRRDFGLEAAQVILGHSRADVTQVYAERNRALAMDVVRQIG